MTKKSNKRHLRTGYTTGTCASAAAKGAAMTLLGLNPNAVEIKLPLGDTATISLCKSWTKNDTAYCTVIKDAGDDPDVTNGAEIGAQVSIIPLGKKIKSEKFPVVLKGGKGVGVVTKPGLPVRKGEAAINPVPRKMIRSAVSEAFSRGSGIVDLSNRVEVTLFVPRGEELAKKTFNPRLGILGGISILGTTGIVKPFSHQAYKETICCALQIARAVKCKEVVLSTGGLSERLAKTYLPCSKEESFIQMGDYVGFSLKEALKNGFHNITVSAFMGKLSKIAAGCTYTHARNFPLDIELFISLGKRLGIKTRVLKEISHSITTRGILEILLKHRECSIIDAICTQAVEELYQMSQGKGKIFLVLFSFDNEVLWYGSREGKIAGIK
ncbi:MAG: cobalt-precorrin-5B (C(1))-methyltransferase [Deltaproteobacteria bacterium]|jgi:cobalt-precorrin-5B (C1)-methyltransferase|nr:cobalt-precorrin-5B (C(1))-methyltransferase [Deltaproteobacteria bacterium]MBW2553219.1 cobalt-precorrin-5B (C(1))-methyltransferase [Deltaproteobacteria bacterium]MBW2651817.1 cobalt-precorrin-5B (C(1))-methyltransferase [Deltaproteobacteria bacterium]